MLESISEVILSAMVFIVPQQVYIVNVLTCETSTGTESVVS